MGGKGMGRWGLIAGLAGAIVLAGCSGGSPTSSSTGTTPTSSTQASPTGSGDIASVLQSVTGELQSGKQATFKAVYSISTDSGAQTITSEQKPPASLFSTTDGEILNTGTASYVCGNTTGVQECFSAGATGGVNPLAGLTTLLDPSTVTGAFSSVQAAIAAHVPGYSATTSNANYAGQSAKCITITGGTEGGEYCITTFGLLAYVKTGSGALTLTSYSTNVPASDFATPANVVTIPSSIP